jgi:serine/threonine protein kinase
MQDSAHHLHPGALLNNGRYYIGRALGQGGFGITYLGWDNVLSARVAIKEYFPLSLVTRGADGQSVSYAGGEARADFEYGLVRFMDEARVLASFSATPGIVSVRDVFKENSLAYMVMEYLEGHDLKHKLSESGGRISPESALDIAICVTSALRDVHAQKLMHRDVSPDNIFITSDGRVKLIDFGAARFSFGTQNKSLSVVLKPSYAPVEQYQTRGNQGPWTDIYALGATLYRCVTGQLPPEALSRLEDDRLKPPSDLRAEIPPAMEAAIIKALAVKVKDRFQSVQEFQAALLGTAPQPMEPQDVTRRLVTTRVKAPADQTVALTVALSTNTSVGESTFSPDEERRAGEETERYLVPCQTERFRAEPTGTASVSREAREVCEGSERSSGTKKWIALILTAIVIVVSAGVFCWMYWAMPEKTPEKLNAQTPDRLIPESVPESNEDSGELYRSGVALLNNGDISKAESLLERAANSGHAKAMSALGFLNQRQGDQEKSYEWYKKAAEAGDSDAVMPLAQFYYFGQVVPKDYKTAVSLLRPLADAGNVNAKIMLSNIFREGGYGIARNTAEADRYRK